MSFAPAKMKGFESAHEDAEQTSHVECAKASHHHTAGVGILAEAAPDVVTDSTERVNALGEKLFALHPSGGRAQRARRWARKHMPPGSSQEDYDKLVTPHMLWLTAAQLEARKVARDLVIALRRAKRRAKRELSPQGDVKLRATATHAARIREERIPIVRADVLKGRVNRQAARHAKRAGRGVSEDVHQIIRIKESIAAAQQQLVESLSEPAATSTRGAEEEDSRYIETFVLGYKDGQLGLSDFTFCNYGWLYVERKNIGDTPSKFYINRISSEEQSDQYEFPNVWPAIVLAMRAADLSLVPCTPHNDDATIVVEPVFGVVCGCDSFQVDDVAMHLDVELSGKESPRDKKASIGVATAVPNVPINHVMSCERNGQHLQCSKCRLPDVRRTGSPMLHEEAQAACTCNKVATVIQPLRGPVNQKKQRRPAHVSKEVIQPLRGPVNQKKQRHQAKVAKEVTQKLSAPRTRRSSAIKPRFPRR